MQIQRLGDGRVGYPLGPVLSCMESPACTLRRRVRSLYPGFSEAQVERFIHFLLLRRASPFTTLLRQEMEYAALDRSLRAWARQGDAGALCHLDDRDAPEHAARITALVAAGAVAADQALGLVEV